MVLKLEAHSKTESNIVSKFEHTLFNRANYFSPLKKTRLILNRPDPNMVQRSDELNLKLDNVKINGYMNLGNSFILFLSCWWLKKMEPNGGIFTIWSLFDHVACVWLTRCKLSCVPRIIKDIRVFSYWQKVNWFQQIFSYVTVSAMMVFSHDLQRWRWLYDLWT